MFNFLQRRTKTEHDFCQENLSAFLDGQLTPLERSHVERHLEECAACRADLEALRHTVALLHAVPAVKPPRSFFIPVGEVTRQRQVQRRRLAYVYVQAATAVATVLLVLVVSGDALLRYQAAKPAATLRVSPALVTRPVEVATEEVISMPAAVPQQSPEIPTAAPTESVDAGEARGMAAAPQQSPEQPTVAAPTELFGAGETRPAEAPQIVVEGQTLEPMVMPSQTFAKVAEPRVPLTLTTRVEISPLPTEIVRASPTAETMAAISTTVLLPVAIAAATDTPVLPTATPSSTVVPPTATPSPTNTIAPTESAVQLPSPQPAAGEAQERGQFPPVSLSEPWAFLEVLRPFLPWLELTLVVAVVVLLLTTLWLRRRQRLV